MRSRSGARRTTRRRAKVATVAFAGGLLVGATACADDVTAKTDDTSASNGTASAPGGDITSGKCADGADKWLYPKVQGATWNLRMVDDSGKQVGTEQIAIASLDDADGYTDAHMRLSSQLVGYDPGTNEVIYRFRDDGSMLTPAQSFGATGSVVQIDEQSGQVVPSVDDVIARKHFEGSVTARDGDMGSTIRWASDGAGTERVTVPAGTFDAVKLVSSMTISVDGAGGGEPLETTQWFAKGVGIVKQSVPGTTFELTSVAGVCP